jgi:hypothetical protein
LCQKVFSQSDNFGVAVGSEWMGEPIWRTARRCESGQCVEIGTLGDSVLIRNSADRDGERLALSRDEWQEFVAGVKDGDFDGL